MSTPKLTLIIASLALALAWAVTASAANAAEINPARTAHTVTAPAVDTLGLSGLA